MTRAVLLDALGTLLALTPPAPALVGQLRARGVTVDEAQATAALRVEMSYYRAHCHQAGDRAALAQLRARCTQVLGDALPGAGAGLGPAELQEALLASLRFTAYPDVAPELRALRRRGLRLVVVSNWDVSLHDALAATGLDALLDGVVTSGEAGVSKPDPAIFARALALARALPEEALHAGDDVALDVDGARAAGIRPVLIARDGPAEGVGDDVAVLSSLAGLRQLTA